MSKYSKYVVVVDNVSSVTPTRDMEREASRYGRVRDIQIDYKERCALLEYHRADDAQYAWRKMDGTIMDGRKWKVEWATRSDFKLFGWKWTEGGSDSPQRSCSPSISPSHHGPTSVSMGGTWD
ncbi:hypothetical protein FOA52_010671 [Chlamydomonas sp. UWO 241]|nr:hypothetical protein FOA52_010671 [Chlamydomonas sp. UWO 241]